MPDANETQHSARDVVGDALDLAEADWFESRDDAADRVLGALSKAGYTLMPSGGVWICSYSDRSGHAVFATEVEALRHAVGCSMAVDFVAWGEF